MKFRNYLESIAGISIYPLISLLIFVIFFAVLIIFVMRMDRKHVDRMKSVPLDDSLVKKSILTLVAFFLVPAAFAQGTAPASYENVLWYVVLFFLGSMILILLVVLGQVISLYQKITTSALPQEVKKETTPLFSDGWWRKFNGFSTTLSEEEKILIKGHEYDGIHELDNRMPPWLQLMFVGTIIFAFAYTLYYHVFEFGDLQEAELQHEIAMADIQKKSYIEKMGAGINEENVTLLDDPGKIKEGGVIYQEKCVACHAADGGGGVGPNLTDNYWLHGGSIQDVFKIVKYGVPEKGMISWEKQLPPMEIQKVASFILAELHGSKPATPKEAQGELYEKPVDVPTNPVPVAVDNLSMNAETKK